jgi:chromate reductase
MPAVKMKILAMSGSLRATSINSALLRTVARLAPAGVEVTVCSLIGELPLFNPDLESRLPAEVKEFHAQVAACSALMIASPEYAHGVSGSIKNALDWLVSFEPFVHKPVAVLNTSPRAHLADTALRETLRTMSAVVVEAACVSIPLLGAKITEAVMAESPLVAQPILASLNALCSASAQPSPGELTHQQLERYLHEHIPLSRAMGVSVLEILPGGVTLGAPLAPNINHRDTAFGGSISAVAVLAAWSLLHVRLSAAGGSRLVIQRHSMTYQRPIAGPFIARSFLPDAAAWEKFVRTLARRGRARIAVSCCVEYQGRPAGQFEGDFVALGAGE